MSQKTKQNSTDLVSVKEHDKSNIFNLLLLLFIMGFCRPLFIVFLCLTDRFAEVDLSGGFLGDSSRLVSPAMTSSVPRCLRFRYKIIRALSFSFSVCTLSVFDGMEFLDCSTWTRTSSEGDNWSQGQTTLQARASPFSVVFQAATRGFWGGSVSIDNVDKIDGACS